MEKTPGVYVREINTLPASVVPISTAVPVFIGYTETAGVARELDYQAVKISSLLEYEQSYGKAENQALIVSVEDSLAVGVTVDTANASPYHMYYQLLMYFLNGGGPCYVISVGAYKSSAPLVVRNELDETIDVASGSIGGLAVARKIDEITLLVFPDAPGLGDSDYYSLYQDALKQCGELKDRFTLIDVKDPVSVSESGASVSAVDAFRGTTSFSGIGSNHLSYGAAYYPRLSTSLSYQYDADGLGTDTMTFVSAGVTLSDSEVAALRDNTAFVASLERLIPQLHVELEPSGAMAGIYAQTDRARGVFNAPANISLNSVVAPTIKITDEEQQDFNVHSTGKSINAIRAFAGRGVLVWGARTLDGNSNEWRYVSVRRFFLFVEESLKKAVEPFVFEGNNESSWLRIRGLIENFLTDQWRAGALFGATAEQAFFVNLGLGSTMTANDVLNGRLIVEVGLAAVRPAEFIILRFTHKIQDA